MDVLWNAATVLLTKDYAAKLCDFGLSKLRGRTSSTMRLSEHVKDKGVGTMAYMAPELLDFDNDANEKTDVYSFGILLVCPWETRTRRAG